MDNHSSLVCTFQYVSDLHLEYYDPGRPNKWPKLEPTADILIIAGDLGRVEQKQYTLFLEQYSKQYQHILLVPGNHEYYNGKKVKTMVEINTLLDQIDIPNVHVLRRASIVLNGIRFVGATLWTLPEEQERSVISYMMNDYTKIYSTETKKITIDETITFHIQDRDYILSELKHSQEPVVVITHHCPTKEHVFSDPGIGKDPLQKPDEISTAYYTSLPEYFFSHPLIAWITGHVHSCFQMVRNFDNHEVSFLSNCRGYPSQQIEGYSPSRSARIVCREGKYTILVE